MAANIEVCTVREVADALRVSQATIRRLIAASKLPAMRVGRSVRVDRSVLARLVAEGKVSRGK
ncbi:MAG: helix-turn-helix domain-containing protein [Planctomycetota bacterium]